MNFLKLCEMVMKCGVEKKSGTQKLSFYQVQKLCPGKILVRHAPFIGEIFAERFFIAMRTITKGRSIIGFFVFTHISAGAAR